MAYVLLTLAVFLFIKPQLVLDSVKIGGGTFYYGETFEGSNLKCPGYRYEEETGPWVALDIADYGDWWQ